MSAAEHAGNILSAWVVADQHRFAAELANARLCSDSAHGLEFERHELLNSIAEQFESLREQKCFSSAKLHAGFYLLRHLAALPGAEEKVAALKATKRIKTRIRH